MEPTNVTNSTEAARKSSLIERFSIDGLYGYKSVTLESKHAATVLIARNGSGKTTLLAALDAFLRGQFSRFASLKFDVIVCKLSTYEKDLCVYRHHVEQLIELTSNSEIGLKAKTWEVEPLALLEFLESETGKLKWPDVYEHQIFQSIYSKLGFDHRLAVIQCEKLADQLASSIPHLAELRRTLREALLGVEIAYLPTYRRIELSLPNREPRPSERGKKSVLARLGVTRSGLYTADIQFGLSDISERLRTLYSQLLFQANQGYGKVSTNIINDLITGNYKAPAITKTPPSKEALELFFDRIKNAELEYRRLPYQSLFQTPDLDRVYSGDISDDAKPFLTYFLDQLNLVIQETRGSEERVAAFIDSCNKYLSGDGQTTLYEDEMPDDSLVDRKELVFLRKRFEVKVKSVGSGTAVPMEALSSGEKQMVSLFARLYLYPGPKIILIDEPELSLSIDWQRQILPDVLLAPNCKQVIAITHSPFIFDNELEPFAGSLKIRVAARTPELFKDEEDALSDGSESGD